MNAFTLVLAVSTFCNPMPIPDTPVGILIRDTPNGQSYEKEAGWRRVFWSRGADLKPETTRQFRELADPAVYVENGRWYLYPSCGLMWTSDDGGGTWRHEKVVEKGEYAPAIAKFRGRYYLCTSGGPLSVADAPTGPFETLGKFDMESFGPKGEVPWTGDPALLADGDRLYLYWGCCSYPKAIWGVELDPENPLRARTPGSAKCLMEFDTKRYPWLKELIEGAWAFKRGDTYYLCYSTANTAEADYQWCCLKGKAPLGPFEPQSKNPFFVTERGLVTGTGHGSIWSTQPDEWWISSCVHVGAYHGFERLICMDRISFEPNGDIAVGRATETPQWLTKSGRTGDTGWRKLALAGGPVEPTDDRFSTWWQAETGDSGAPALPATLEYALDGPQELHAMRLIWRDVGLDTTRGVLPGPFQYRVDVRERGVWRTWIDATANVTDLLVDYREGEVCVADGVRLVVLGAPKGIVPGVADFTVFGLSAYAPRYLFFGDSITGQSRNHAEGWAHQMDECLAEAAARAGSSVVPEIVSLGGSGQTVGSWLRGETKSRDEDTGHLDIACWNVKAEIERRPCDAAVVFLGMNDVLQPTLGESEADFDKWEATYRELLTSLFARTAAKRRFLATVTPCTEDPTSFKNRLEDGLNARVARLAKELDATVIPLHDAFVKALAEGRRVKYDFHVTDDFVHPNGIGHTVIAAEFLKALGETRAAAVAERNFRRRLRQFTEVRPGLSWTIGAIAETAEKGVFAVPVKTYWVQRWDDAPDGAAFEMSAPEGWTVEKRGRDEFVLTGRPTAFRTPFVLTGRQDGITRTATVGLPAPWRVTKPEVRRKEFKDLVSLDGAGFTWVPFFATVNDTGLDDPNSLDFTMVDHIPVFAGAFAERTVVAPRACEATLDIGTVQFAGFSDLTVWLNGEQVYADRAVSRMDKDRGHRTARVKLRAGENRLLVKTVRFTWQWQLFVGLVPDDPAVVLTYGLTDR